MAKKWPEVNVQPTTYLSNNNAKVECNSKMPCGKSVQGYGTATNESAARHLAFEMIKSNAVSHLDSHGCAKRKDKR